MKTLPGLEHLLVIEFHLKAIFFLEISLSFKVEVNKKTRYGEQDSSTELVPTGKFSGKRRAGVKDNWNGEYPDVWNTGFVLFCFCLQNPKITTRCQNTADFTQLATAPDSRAQEPRKTGALFGILKHTNCI